MTVIYINESRSWREHSIRYSHQVDMVMMLEADVVITVADGVVRVVKDRHDLERTLEPTHGPTGT